MSLEENQGASKAEGQPDISNADATEKPLRAFLEERFASLEGRLDRVEQRISSLEEGFDHLEENMSSRIKALKEHSTFLESRVEFLQLQGAGIARPVKLNKIPGGYGLIEPRSTWRSERPYRR